MDLEQVGTDLGGHLRCVQDLSHITAIEFLKTAPMSGGLNETEMLQHVHCIYEGAIETGIRNVCNIQRVSRSATKSTPLERSCGIYL